MAAEVAIDITKTYPGRPPIHAAIRYPLDQATSLVLFGPSGSGKTTVLRSIAGLEWPERGTIRFISRTWLDAEARVRVPPQERRIGYMPQDYALFPNYTVAGNIGYGLGELSLAERMTRVEEMIELFQLQGLESAKPRELSGGQQQRVALARAVAPRPQLLLLDEPLSALDAPTRVQVRGDLRRLLTQLALPSIIVTHDWTEALTFGDVIAVMGKGNVLQVGSPKDVFSRPKNADVALIVGVETVVEGSVIEQGEGLATVRVNGTTLKGLGAHPVGASVLVCIRAEDVVLEPAGSGMTSARNHLVGSVTGMMPQGVMVQVMIDCGFPLAALVTRGAMEDLRLCIGSPVTAAMKAGAVHLISR
ncbi:MAG: ABC transporter ATP-binding protein [Nitrospira sp.]|jgi:molybdate transport system ATP-binding protein|nr:ABC transporter ATP-binding protein [Nitrospira sp.]